MLDSSYLSHHDGDIKWAFGYCSLGSGDWSGWKYLPQRWNLRQEPGEITKQRTVDREKSKGKAGERRG